jgi:hypothetical protein
MMVMSRRSEKTGQRRIRRFADSPFRRFMPFLVCVLAIAMAGASVAQDEEQEEASNAKPDAGGVVIEPSSGKIAEGDTITITFPVSMVAADLIDVGDQPSPFVSEPKLDGTFLEICDHHRIQRAQTVTGPPANISRINLCGSPR